MPMTRADLLSALADRIPAIACDHPLRVAIDGVDASGKTVLADDLAAVLRSRGATVIRASIDGFHNPRDVRHRQGSDSPRGYYEDSFDHTALVEELLSPLGPKGTRRYRTAVFDLRADRRVDAPAKTAPDEAILVFDGVFLQRPELRDHWDYRVFVKASFETTLRRAMQRDRGLFGTPEQVRHRYESRYIPGQRLYLERCEPEGTADVVVENDDVDRPSLRARC
jgi:uridine kinase